MDTYERNMIDAIINTLIYNGALFILLLIAIGIGTVVTHRSKNIAIFLMFAVGAAITFFCLWLIDYFRDYGVYRWYYFVSSFMLISMMNDGNTKSESSAEAYHASTFLFGGVVISSIVYWIYF